MDRSKQGSSAGCDPAAGPARARAARPAAARPRSGNGGRHDRPDRRPWRQGAARRRRPADAARPAGVRAGRRRRARRRDRPRRLDRVALRAALGQPGRLQRPARRPRPVHDHPGRPVARLGWLLRERQLDLAQPLGRRHQDRMQGGARHARRPAPGRPAPPDRGDRRHRQGHRDPRPAGRLRARHHDRPQTAGRHLDRPQRRHLVPLVGRGQGPARRRSARDANPARAGDDARSRA